MPLVLQLQLGPCSDAPLSSKVALWGKVKSLSPDSFHLTYKIIREIPRSCSASHRLLCSNITAHPFYQLSNQAAIRLTNVETRSWTEEENIAGEFWQVFQLWCLIALAQPAAEDHHIYPQLRFSQGFSVTQDNTRPGEGKINGCELGGGVWWSTVRESLLGSFSWVLSVLTPTISLSNPCCYTWLATTIHLTESRNGKQLLKYHFGDCQHYPITTNTWGCLTQEEGWWPTLTVEGVNICRSWALLTAPCCSPLASHTYFGASRCSTLKPQGSLGINFLHFLLRSELQLTKRQEAALTYLIVIDANSIFMKSILPTFLNQKKELILNSCKITSLLQFQDGFLNVTNFLHWFWF